MLAEERSAAAVLFEPVRIGSMQVPNRIAMAPMTREFSPNGVPGADVAAYYRRRAAGGAGLIITEGMAVNAAGAHDGPIPVLFQPEAAAAAGAIARAVKAEGACVIPQLWHVGVQDTPTTVNPATVKQRPRRVGPSGLSGAGEASGDALDDEGIAQTIADFAAATRAAIAAGFDGVEIHGAHGYLPDQFLWPKTNRRADGWGGEVGGRTRFLAELIRACKAAADGRPVILRMSQWKSSDYAARLADNPGELEAILAPLVAAGVDAIHCSTRRFFERGFAGDPRTLAGWVKALTGLPVIAVGSVTLATEFKDGTTEASGGIAESGARSADVDDVARLIDAGEFDLIAVGRAMIANPDWAALVRAGRANELKPFSKALLATLE
ncbi:2,4-dienoyl-CoA reductase-like NADH-dependent reductase (Old Yellow Enzyme family) [Sphingomonas jejuensis]|uniref:2,4-dienoyl-CoA reductase-like NADH-dependent reductase (Old Yellow Enzyme family) n=1 Tax=Sphingomonas jejuensis TaxID=904715 RepID=A0ABX0XL56_9SPHN|nr:12-oxophytodienoate reductase [Sphingomonas jejuensis]NJC33970.1 2,4-dienoyl-CoA reductase-like NADH-dependent reductase (Old Yellow Enzyme family) [Sphingomonas jejuensis]